MADDISITPGTGATVATDQVSDGTLGTVHVQYVKLMDGTLDGTSKAAVGANGLAVDVKAMAPGTAATSLGKAEDAAHSSGDVGVMALGVRNDAATSISGTDGDYTPLATTAQGYAIVSGAAADNAAVTQKPVPVGFKFSSASPTYDDGDVGYLRADVNGFLQVTQATLGGGEDLTTGTQGITPKVVVASTYSPSLYSELTQVTKANIKGSAGNVVGFYITNDNAAVRYFQLHNKATAPVATEVPIYTFKVPAGTANNPGVLEIGTEFFTQAGKYFATGIGWAISTTMATFTDSATNTEHIALVHYF